MSMSMSRLAEKTSLLLVAAAWVVVTLPLAWGVYQTAIKSAPLFGPPAAAAEPARPAAHR